MLNVFTHRAVLSSTPWQTPSFFCPDLSRFLLSSTLLSAKQTANSQHFSAQVKLYGWSYRSVSQECFSSLSCHAFSTSFTGSSERFFFTIPFTFSLLLLFKSHMTHFLVHICETSFKYLNLKNVFRVLNKGLLNLTEERMKSSCSFTPTQVSCHHYHQVLVTCSPCTGDPWTSLPKLFLTNEL